MSENVNSKIDWNGKLEAVQRPSGKVAGAKLSKFGFLGSPNPDYEGDYWVDIDGKDMSFCCCPETGEAGPISEGWTIRNVADADKAPADAVQGDLTSEGSPGASDGVEASGGAVAGRDTVTVKRMTEEEIEEEMAQYGYAFLSKGVVEFMQRRGMVKPATDPLLLKAREICAEEWPEGAAGYHSGDFDYDFAVRVVLRALRKGR